ncbi:MAG: tetratricopeptide repeat protein [Bacteroidetes bacterium]|nr:tetratricopeptide repeat protein [Bacteroidota bacterium]
MKTILVISVLALSVFVLNQCAYENKKPAVYNFVGSSSCMSCHKTEFALYHQSDHFKAMDTAVASSVLANFNNTFFIYYGDTSFFYQRDGKYFVKTVDTTGQKKEFRVNYTFGWKPLQQYLVEFGDGRLQVLPFCWDTRPKEKGGQRWFHIYNKENILPNDELFWMRYNQNWNYMCADCHTTDFKKNFNLTVNSFHSYWRENNVSCESCHGPGSRHIEWAKDTSVHLQYKGFLISLASKQINWKMDEAKGTALPETIVYNDTLISTCARCHARALRFTDDYTYGASFLQSHSPTAVTTENYYVDGQIKDEDYEYGSFLQSKMYARGVTCINCHEPHSMKIKLEGNNLCYSCHSPEKFGTPAHSFHPVSSTGSSCVSCHMPVTTYMVVDDRRDHSIRIPRPDQSLMNGTPNACNKCHTDKSVKWASDYFLKWYGDKLPKEKTYKDLLAAIAAYTKESGSSLNELLSSASYPAIIRAGAMEQYSSLYTPGVLEKVKSNLVSEDPLLRRSAAKSMNGLPADIVIPSVSPLLKDKIKAVRLEAVFTLASYFVQLDETTKADFANVYKEYIDVQQSLSHNPEGYLNQGIIMGLTGKTADAEQMYLDGLKRFPGFIPYFMNLADIYRQQKQETKAKEYLEKGLKIDPSNADLNYASGLWYYRQNDEANGLLELKKAYSLNPANVSVVYGLSIALNSSGNTDKAINILEGYLDKHGNNASVLDGLISICHDSHKDDKAGHYNDIRKSVFGY